MSQQLTSPWKNLPKMTKPRGECAAATLRGKLYAVGGSSGGDEETMESYSINKDIESYDINEGRWTQAPARMSENRNSCALAAIGNSLYVAGGDDGVSWVSVSVEAFDIDRGLWKTLNSMNTARWGCEGVAVGDEFMVFGGKGDSHRVLNTVECFNVRTGRWKSLPPMNNRRSWCAATVIKNKVYIVGGFDGDLSLDTVEVFDMTTRTWTFLPHRMTTRRHGCAAAAVGNYLIIVGGEDGTSALNTVEVYDVKTETLMELPSMSTKRVGCAAVSLGGSVYVMGGQNFVMTDDEGSNLDSVEEIQFNDDVIKGMLAEWSEGSWRNEVAPILHRRTSVIHQLDIDIALMPTLLSRVGGEERVQTIFEMVRGQMGVFENACWRPNKKQKRC